MNEVKLKPGFDPRIVIGFLVSILISIILYITGSSTIPSITVGFLGSILTVLITVRLDLHKTENQLLDAIGFSQELYKDEWLSSVLRAIIKSYFVIKLSSQAKPVYMEQLQMALQVCYATIDELAKGKISTGNEDERIRLMITAVREAKKSVKAVSYINIKWWVSELATKFLEENREAIKRDIQVERIFIIQELNAELLALINKQLDFNIKVYIVLEKDVPSEIRQNFIICDDVLITEPRFNLEGTNQGGIISTAERDVSRIRQIWGRLMMFSREIKNIDDVKTKNSNSVV